MDDNDNGTDTLASSGGGLGVALEADRNEGIA